MCLPFYHKPAEQLSGIESLLSANTIWCFDDGVSGISGCSTSPYAVNGKSKANI